MFTYSHSMATMSPAAPSFGENTELGPIERSTSCRSVYVVNGAVAGGTTQLMYTPSPDVKVPHGPACAFALVEKMAKTAVATSTASPANRTYCQNDLLIATDRT